MIWGWIVPEVIATAASGLIGLTFGQAIIYVVGCIALILIIQLARAKVSECRIAKLRTLHRDGLELLNRRIEVGGNYGREIIEPFEKQWWSDFESYKERANKVTRKVLTDYERQILENAPPQAGPNFLGFYEQACSTAHHVELSKLAGKLIALEELICKKSSN